MLTRQNTSRVRSLPVENEIVVHSLWLRENYTIPMNIDDLQLIWLLANIRDVYQFVVGFGHGHGLWGP